MGSKRLLGNIYICPSCKKTINNDLCSNCKYILRWHENMPVFFDESCISKQYENIGKYYDNLYDNNRNVWEKVASRGSAFVEYIASLIVETKPIRYLDIGCGEGFQLAATNVYEKHGIDISIEALKAAQNRSSASYCVGYAENLPYMDGYFDIVTSIGVMTHFIDDHIATREIHRVLRADGIYLVGAYIKPTKWENIYIKMSKYIFPYPKFITIAYNIKDKLFSSLISSNGEYSVKKEKQPIEILYTPDRIKNIFIKCGFKVVKIITKYKQKNVPLPGHHFRIYILKKHEFIDRDINSIKYYNQAV